MKFLMLFLLPAALLANLSPETTHQLIESARKARELAYAPYSNYAVGSAVLTKSGKIYSGCNIENASYGLVICAERCAIFKAVSEGERDIEAIAVVTRDGGFCCGACRQVLNEFNPNMTVICADAEEQASETVYLDEILPHAFGPSNLQ